MCEYTVCDISHIITVYPKTWSVSSWHDLCAERSGQTYWQWFPTLQKKIQRSSKISRTMRQLLITDTNFRFDPLLEDYPTE